MKSSSESKHSRLFHLLLGMGAIYTWLCPLCARFRSAQRRPLARIGAGRRPLRAAGVPRGGQPGETPSRQAGWTTKEYCESAICDLRRFIEGARARRTNRGVRLPPPVLTSVLTHFRCVCGRSAFGMTPSHNTQNDSLTRGPQVPGGRTAARPHGSVSASRRPDTGPPPPHGARARFNSTRAHT